jgi:hypothetical protein
MPISSNSQWQLLDSEIFWGEIAPTEHVLQIYDSDVVFLNLLEGYVAGGIKAGDCVILIATGAHLNFLKERLYKEKYNIDALCADDQLILLDAEETLGRFMVNDWPDADLFYSTISGVIDRARSRNRHVRAFGEMVALLWAKGLNGATVQLESLWNQFCSNEALCLFCAYPKVGFTQDASESLHTICCAHAKIVSGEYTSTKQIYYKQLA